jgi:threonine-phosphate decarboxylase
VRAGSARAHGADVFDAAGKPRRLTDFSSTVIAQAPPDGWKAQWRRAADRLLQYPQTRSQGLAAAIEARLGLPEGSVLVGNGSLECLHWLAQAAQGERVVLEGPFFGEYLPLLQAAGARPMGISAAQQPARASLLSTLNQPAFRKAWAWVADPANPSGLALAPADLAALLRVARRQSVRLVLDQALLAQRLDESGPDLALFAATRPGLFLSRSLSKGLGLPGLRLGYLVAHPKEIGKLLPYTQPWSVNSAAQALGAWALREEARRLPARRHRLAVEKADLLRRLLPLRALGLRAQASETGYFLLALPSKGLDAPQLEARLESQGLLIRPCHTYGKWGRRFIRLNPRAPRENQGLVAALKRAYA